MLKASVILIRARYANIGPIVVTGDNVKYITSDDNEILIFDDTSEVATAIRPSTNPNYSGKNAKFEVTSFEYDVIQYISCAASAEQVKNLLDRLVTENVILPGDVQPLYNKIVK